MKQPGKGYEVLVALPLAFVTIFCFGFVMMHPYYKPQAATNRAVAVSVNGPSSSPAPTTVNIAKAPPYLSVVPLPPPSSPASSSTTTTQQSSSSSTASLQAATTNSATGKKVQQNSTTDTSLVKLGL